MRRGILTVDVEDNFTCEELVNKDDWPKYESQVVDNTLRILALLKSNNARATFFIVGKVAERHPELIKYICQDEHEIASHSYWHKPLNLISPREIEEDIRMSRDILSSLTGTPILGYRSMGYSIPDDEKGFYTLLKEYGYAYSSSRKPEKKNNVQTIMNGNIFQIYPSVINLFGSKLVFSGGTYFRILPIYVINKGCSVYQRLGQPIMIYVHPWEFNNDQPKRKVPLMQKMLQSPITFTTERKLTYLLQRYNFTSIKEYIGL
ncbi:MAG: polysaccharide deacetylase family protein [Candidatus Omnitrophica bacterium]|nr:polysaccharide deacetylase family protein [Candidatus Omnitrophota bacterium]